MQTLKNGFTIKELAMVIVVIGILCIAAIPPFYALQSARRRTEFEKTITLVTDAVKKAKDAQAVLPEQLDQNPAQSPCLSCFSSVLEKPESNPLWYKFGPGTYLYSTNGNHNTVTDYQESGDYKVEYVDGGIRWEEIKSSQ